MEISKLDEVIAASKGGFGALVNKHLHMKIHENDGERPMTAEEYLRSLGQASGVGNLVADFGEGREIYKHIIKTNQIVELYVHPNLDPENYHHLVHYDFNLAVNEAWGLLELLGLVGEHAK